MQNLIPEPSKDFCLFPPTFLDEHYVDSTIMTRMLHEMLRIRYFEEEVAELVQEKKIITPCHLYTGQEAVAVGICAALRKDDYLFGNHRSHGHYLAKGGDMNSAMAEIFCRVTGCSGGRGGSMHLCAPDIGVLGTSSIVAGSMGVAVGAALAESIRKTGRISVVFHGDGVPEEGIWHESANFAALNKLPVIFVCENNLYCTHLPLHRRRAKDNIPEIAAAHDFQCRSVDGNNVLEVYHAAKQAVSETREGNGPWFIECRTYRWRGHVGPNLDIDLGLRSEEELDVWKKRDPIKSFADHMINEKIISQNEYDRLSSSAGQEVKASVVYAMSSLPPSTATVGVYVIKE